MWIISTEIAIKSDYDFIFFEAIATNVPNSNSSRNVTALRIVVTLFKEILVWYILLSH